MAGTKRRNCAALQTYFGLLDKYPEYRMNQGALEAATREFMNRGDAALRTALVTIPVVVHVLENKAASIVSDGQIHNQIEVLNADFQNKSCDLGKVPEVFKPYVANPNLAFVLAPQDPTGQPTDGIHRRKTRVSEFAADDAMKSSSTGGADALDTNRYLNMWVCNLGGGLLGYAQFPGGPIETDGVVITSNAFGSGGSAESPFDLGRTTVHEVGHYLNLSHIWGESRFPTCDDSDYLTDTPNQYAPNYGQPKFPVLSCNNGPHGDMFMNFMDYVDDNAMVMFSRGQVARMRAALENSRNQLGLNTDGKAIV